MGNGIRRRLAAVFLAIVSLIASDALAQATKPQIVFAIAEDEYHAAQTLPAFAREQLEREYACRFLQSDSKTDLPGLEALKQAELLVMFMRRRSLPKAQVDAFKAYFDSGRPVIGLRTACHAFQNWPEFDGVVFGSHYHNHYPAGKSLTAISVVRDAAGSPLLKGVAAHWQSHASLYRMNPLAERCTALLSGVWEDAPPEPVAWTTTYHGGKVFFTSLGGPEDFADENFRTLLKNAVGWSLQK